MLINFDLFCCFRTNFIFAAKFFELKEEKIELIEEFTQHYLQTTSLPPLAAKIYSFLLVEGIKEGYTFDDLVNIFNVSKSSVSTSLNLLIKYDYIVDFNRIGERKRRYRITAQHLPLRLKKIQKELIREKYLAERLMQHRFAKISHPDPVSIEKGEIYISHLGHAIERLEKTIEKLENLTQKL
jgi:DNA-binding transcriptional regulator GbsR (MarR family)